MLLRRDDQCTSHGMRHHNETFQTHTDVVPSPLIVFKRQVAVVVVGVVGGDGTLVLCVARDDFPVNDLGFGSFAVADHHSPLLHVPCSVVVGGWVGGWVGGYVVTSRGGCGLDWDGGGVREDV